MKIHQEKRMYAHTHKWDQGMEGYSLKKHNNSEHVPETENIEKLSLSLILFALGHSEGLWLFPDTDNTGPSKTHKITF